MKDESKISPEDNDKRSFASDNLKSNLNRRDFLRLSAAASMGLATGAMGWPKLVSAGGDETSRVVVVTDDQASPGLIIQPDVVRIMIDTGVQALTDAATPQDAWLSLFPDLASDLTIGIKVSTLYQYSASHQDVTTPLTESLASTPAGGGNYPLNQMLIWDRWDSDLIAANFALNTGTTGVRCYGTLPGVGWDLDTINVNGSVQQVSRCYTDESDNLINLCLLKNHVIAGVSHSLKSHYGTIDDPEGLHGGYCNPWIPALNAAMFETHGNRQKVCICDGIFGVTYGGPQYPWNINPNTIILSQDPVALDAICREILIENGCTSTWMSYHIDTASQPPYNLGNSSLEDIERVDIFNPSTAVKSDPGVMTPGRIALKKNYPEPFNASTSIPLELDRTTFVEVRIYDVRGRAISNLYQGTLSPGRHILSWEGTDTTGRPVQSGRYFVRMRAAGRFYTRKITLLK